MFLRELLTSLRSAKNQIPPHTSGALDKHGLFIIDPSQQLYAHVGHRIDINS